MNKQQGVMLIEALIGILIFSIGILAMIGMQATAMRATIDAKYRSEASFLANEILGAMWVNRGVNGANLPNYVTSPGTPASCPTAPVCAWLTRVSGTLPRATGANAPTIEVTVQPTTLQAEVRITVRWQPPGNDTPVSNHFVITQVNG